MENKLFSSKAPNASFSGIVNDTYTFFASFNNFRNKSYWDGVKPVKPSKTITQSFIVFDQLGVMGGDSLDEVDDDDIEGPDAAALKEAEEELAEFDE